MRDFYRIGTLATLTGVPAPTLRAWDRRHGALAIAERSAGAHRLYPASVVARVRLLRRLTDLGHPIGTLAALTDAQLQAQLATHEGTPRAMAEATAQSVTADGVEPAPLTVTLGLGLAIAHPHLLAVWMNEPEELAPRRIIWAVETSSALALRLREPMAAGIDAVIVDAELLDETITLEALREAFGHTPVIMTSHFAPRAWVAQARRLGFQVLVGKVDPDRVRNALARTVRREGTASAPAEFSMAELAALQKIAPSLACECPRHLASLVESLLAFERYSQRCSSSSRADALLHQQIERATSVARRNLEDMLVRVLAHEAIDRRTLVKTRPEPRGDVHA